MMFYVWFWAKYCIYHILFTIEAEEWSIEDIWRLITYFGEEKPANHHETAKRYLVYELVYVALQFDKRKYH